MKKQSKPLSILQIFITICISYFCTSYAHADYNFIHWSDAARVFQILLIGLSLLLQYNIKNDQI